MTDWYCAKPTSAEDSICKRAALLTQLRKPGMATSERKELIEKLKLVPTVYASTQAVTADFCKVSEHATKTPCLRLKSTTASKSMREWYCAQPASSSSMWCKRQTILDKLHKLPSASTDPAQKAEREKLAAEYKSFTTRPSTGGPSPSALIAKEISAAKKSYCAVEANKLITFCRTASSSRVAAAVPGLSRLSSLRPGAGRI